MDAGQGSVCVLRVPAVYIPPPTAAAQRRRVMVLLVDEKAISQEKGAWLIRETDLRLCVPSQ